MRYLFDLVEGHKKSETDKEARNQYTWILGLALLPVIYLLISDTYRTGFYHPPLEVPKGMSL